jgi:integrase
MPRTVRDASLENRTARSRLKARNKPYYRAIEPGLHLGYRKPLSGAGRWLARHYVGEQRYELETIGVADDYSDADGAAILSYRQAQNKARSQMVERAKVAAGHHGPYAVKDAIREYVSWLESNDRGSAKTTRYRAEAFILPALGNIEVRDLTTEQVDQWKANLAEAPARAWTKAPRVATDAEARRRRRASANRVLTMLLAALNRAWRAGKVPSDSAWRRVKRFENTTRATTRYLTIAEGQRLINACEPDFRQVVQVGLATAARYGEITRLRVEDFNPDAGTLAIRRSKTGRERHVILVDEGVELFRELCAGRAGDALLLRRADNEPWKSGHQHVQMRAACAIAKISPPIGFHQLRHTWASLAVMNGAPLMVVAKNLGHSNTRMVETHYGHLSAGFVADAIRAAAPRFGFEPDKKVRSL